MMLYIYPFLNSVTVEFLKYSVDRRAPNRLIWKMRNFLFRTGAGSFAALVTRYVPFKPVRYSLLDVFNRSVRLGVK